MRNFYLLPVRVAFVAACALWLQSSSAVADYVSNSQGFTARLMSEADDPVDVDLSAWSTIELLDEEQGLYRYWGNWSSGDDSELEVWWDITARSDPVVSGAFGVTNNLNVAQNYTVIFNLPVFPVLLGPNYSVGSVGITVSDGGTNGATVDHKNNNAAIPIYQARIDGANYQALNIVPLPLVAPNGGGGTNIGSASYGVQAAPAVLVDMEVEINFRLTAFDSAAVTFNFLVEPVPEASSVLMCGMAGLGMLGYGIKRRRANQG